MAGRYTASTRHDIRRYNVPTDLEEQLKALLAQLGDDLNEVKGKINRDHQDLERAVGTPDGTVIIRTASGGASRPAGGGGGGQTVPITARDEGVVYSTADALAVSDPAYLRWEYDEHVLYADTMKLRAPLGLPYGGTNATLIAAEGGMVYSTPSALAISDPDDIQWDNTLKRLLLGGVPAGTAAPRMSVLRGPVTQGPPGDVCLFAAFEDDRTADGFYVGGVVSQYVLKGGSGPYAGARVAGYNRILVADQSTSGPLVVNYASVCLTNSSTVALVTATFSEIVAWGAGSGMNLVEGNFYNYGTGGFGTGITATTIYGYRAPAIKSSYISNGWPFYQEGANDLNYFNGRMLFGITDPSSALGRLVLKTGTTEVEGISFGIGADRVPVHRSAASTLLINGTLQLGVGLGLAYGGTGNDLSEGEDGAIPYFDTDRLLLTDVGTVGQALISGGAGAPTWSSQWIKSGSDIYYNLGNVVLGSNATSVRLQVSSPNASDVLTLGSPSGGFYLTNLGKTYGLLGGVLSSGNAWLQVGRTDGTATAYNLILQSAGGDVKIGATPTLWAKSDGTVLVNLASALTGMTLSVGGRFGNAATSAVPTLGTLSGSMFLGEAGQNYGIMAGVTVNGYSWMQVQRVDQTATSYNLILQPSGSGVCIGTTSLMSNTLLTVNGAIGTSAPNGGTAKPWKLGNKAAVSPTNPDRTVEIEVDGELIYMAGKTTND